MYALFSESTWLLGKGMYVPLSCLSMLALLQPLVPCDDSAHLSITSKELYRLLTQQPDQVIVFDCRPRSEFNFSHPDSSKYPQWLCIPQELVEAG